MALSTLILKDEAYIKLAGLQINLTENASASDILNALGISKALFFKGITSTTLADNATTSPIVISGANYTPEAGAVVIYDDSEFLWTGSKWERLGRDSSFKLTQSPVSSPSASGAALAFIDTISQNENGNITVTKKNLDTVPVAQGGSGKTTAEDAANVFLSALPAWTANPTDTTYFVRQDTGGSNSFGRVKAETIYNYVAGKASGTWSISVAGNAATATKLATARSLKTKLDSTTAVTFDGSADQDAIPVTGTLPIAHGGTGGTTAETARLNLGIGNSRVFYGICTTAAGTAAKVVTCAEYDQLKAGDMVVVKFDATNTAAVGSLTLSVNGSTAKNIKKLYNATGASNLVAAGELNKDGIAVFVYNGTYWLLTNADYNSTYYYTSIYCTTAAATAAKVAAISGAQELTAGKYFQVWMLYSNTAQSALTLNISSQGAKPIYINGTASSSTNYTLPRGCYIVYYDGTNYHFRTDNKLPGSISGNANTATTWATGRTLTIGSTGKTVDGSSDVSWSLTEIGASVGNTVTDGTSSAAPKISTTVNGITGNAVPLTTASTSAYGVTKLTSSYDATSPDSTLAINGAGVKAAIQTLDVAEVGASSTASDTSDGKYIAKIKEEDGKITATVFTTSVGNTVTAGTGDNAPKISTTVNGVTGNSVELTKASTSVYGATKLTDTYSSSNTTLAVTGAAIASAVGAYLPLAGGTMTGILTLKGNQYADSYSGALNANNSNIYGLNSIYTADASDNAAEGIHFYRSATNVDTLWISGGNIYFVPNRALGTSTTAANSQKVLRGPATITDGYLFAADSTSGLTKQIQATNANTASTIVQRDANGNFSAGTITATSFNGNVPEANLVWGGKNFSASYGCIDAAMIEPLGANRFAFLKAAGLTIEYSTNGGSSWTDYGATDVQKTGLFGAGQSFVLGKHTTAGTNTVNDQLRITIATGAAGLYTVLNKIAIYMSTSGNTVQVKMERALESTPTTFSTHLDWTGISGWSGWNILNISNITTYGNSAASQYGRIRFTFRQTAVNTNYSSASISRIMGFGGMGWTVPSNMARDGHLYSYDNAQNATFPATVTAPTFDGFATKIRVNPSTTPTAVGSIWVTT